MSVIQNAMKKTHDAHFTLFFFFYIICILQWFIECLLCARLSGVYECEGDTIVALKSQVYMSVGRKEITCTIFDFQKTGRCFMLFSVLHGRGKVGKQCTVALYLRASRSNKSFPCPPGALCESLEGEVGVIPILDDSTN